MPIPGVPNIENNQLEFRLSLPLISFAQSFVVSVAAADDTGGIIACAAENIGDFFNHAATSH